MKFFDSWRILRQLICWLGLLLLGLSADAESVRLGVLSSPETSDEAALLEAKLSGQTEMVLLERERMDSIVRERSLKTEGLTVATAVEMGKLLGVDGLLILDSATVEKSKQLRMRLVAVRTGAVIQFQTDDLPLEEAERWAEFRASELQRAKARLAVPRNAARSLTIIGPRASTAGLGALENVLSFLIAQRLSHEPQIFVLERSRMEKLGLEKDLLGDRDAFWTAGSILDGNIERKGTMLAASFTLSSPGVAPVTISVEAESPVALVDELSDKVAQKLTGVPTKAAWNPGEEARLFEEETLWQLRGSHFRRACETADASIALGNRRSEILQMQAVAYAASTSLINLDEWFAEKMPRRERILDALKAVQIMLAPEIWIEETEREKKLRRLANGDAILYFSSEILAAAFHAKDFEGAESELLTQLRAESRTLSIRLLTDFAQIPRGYMNSSLCYISRDNFSFNFDVEDQLMLYAGLFADTVPEVVAFYTRLFESMDSDENLCASLLDQICHSRLRYPLIAKWRKSDSTKIDHEWLLWLQELVKADAPKHRIYGHILRLQPWVEPNMRQRGDKVTAYEASPRAALNELFSALPNLTEEMGNGNIDPLLMSVLLHDVKALDTYLREPELSQFYAAEQEMVRYFVSKGATISNRYLDLALDWEAYRTSGEREEVTTLLKDYIATNRQSPSQFGYFLDKMAVAGGGTPAPTPRGDSGPLATLVPTSSSEWQEYHSIVDKWIGGYFFKLESGTLRKMSPGGQVIAKFPLSDQARGKLWVVNESLYATSEGIVQKIDPQTGTTETLASSFRRPALTILDDQKAWNVTNCFAGPAGELCLLINNWTIYSYNSASREWVCRFSSETVQRNGGFERPLLLKSILSGEFDYTVSLGPSVLSVLLLDSQKTGQVAYGPELFKGVRNCLPQLGQGSVELNDACFDGADLWLFAFEANSQQYWLRRIGPARDELYPIQFAGKFHSDALTVSKDTLFFSSQSELRKIPLSKLGTTEKAPPGS